jgi:hypothetical protein
MDYPPISFSMPEVDAQPLLEHFRKQGVDGGAPGRLNGHIDTHDNDPTASSSFRVEFFNADITNVQVDKSDSTSEEIKMVKFELYVESMKFTYENGSGTGALETDPKFV